MQTWIGRAEEIDALSRALDGNSKVIVCGLPGAGKTTLVREFLERDNLIARWIAPPYVDEVSEEAALLVVEEGGDGSADDQIHAFLARGPHRKVIVIATDPSRFPGAPKVSVAGLSLKANLEQLSDALQFFIDIAPIKISSKEHLLVQSLADAVDGHPASLQALAARLRVHTLEELVAQIGGLPELLGTALTDRLSAAYALLGPEEKRVVQVATMFGGTVTLEDLQRTLETGYSELLSPTQALADLGILRRNERTFRLSRLVMRTFPPAPPDSSMTNRVTLRVFEVARTYREKWLSSSPAMSEATRSLELDCLEAIWRRRKDETWSSSDLGALLILLCDTISGAPVGRIRAWMRELKDASNAGGLLPGDLLRARLSLATSLLVDDMRGAAEEAKEIEGQAGDDAELRLLARFTMARALHFDEALEARIARLESIQGEAERIGAFEISSCASGWIANAHAEAGERAGAIRVGARSIVEAEKCGLEHVIARAKYTFAEMLERLGDCAEARRLLLEVGDAPSLGLTARAYVQMELGYASLGLSLTDEASAHFVAGARLAEARPLLRTFGFSRLGVAFCEMRRAQWTAATLEAQVAYRTLRTVSSPSEQIASLAVRGSAAALAGHVSEVHVARAEIDALGGEQIPIGRVATELIELATRGLSSPGVSDRLRTFASTISRTNEYMLLTLVESLLAAGAGGSGAEELRLEGMADLVHTKGGTIDLRPTPTLRRILFHLAEVHWEDPRKSISFEELAASVWVDQKISFGALKNRINVSLSKLRKLGLPNTFEVSDARVRISGLVRIRRDP